MTREQEKHRKRLFHYLEQEHGEGPDEICVPAWLRRAFLCKLRICVEDKCYAAQNRYGKGLRVPGDCLRFKQYKWLFFQVYAKVFHGLIVLIEPKTFNCMLDRHRRSLSPAYYKNLSRHPAIPNIGPVFSSYSFYVIQKEFWQQTPWRLALPTWNNLTANLLNCRVTLQ